MKYSLRSFIVFILLASLLTICVAKQWSFYNGVAMVSTSFSADGISTTVTCGYRKAKFSGYSPSLDYVVLLTTDSSSESELKMSSSSGVGLFSKSRHWINLTDESRYELTSQFQFYEVVDGNKVKTSPIRVSLADFKRFLHSRKESFVLQDVETYFEGLRSER